MNEKELTIDMMKNAASNLDKLFDPPIKIENIDSLKKDLKEIGNSLLEDDKDELSDDTQKVLVTLGVKLPWIYEEVIIKVEPEVELEVEPEVEPEVELEVEQSITKDKKISRISLYHQAIKELCISGATRKEIMERSNELYRKNGGTAKFKATNIANISLGTLIKFNILVENEDKKLKLV